MKCSAQRSTRRPGSRSCLLWAVLASICCTGEVGNPPFDPEEDIASFVASELSIVTNGGQRELLIASDAFPAATDVEVLWIDGDETVGSEPPQLAMRVAEGFRAQMPDRVSVIRLTPIVDGEYQRPDDFTLADTAIERLPFDECLALETRQIRFPETSRIRLWNRCVDPKDVEVSTREGAYSVTPSMLLLEGGQEALLELTEIAAAESDFVLIDANAGGSPLVVAVRR